MGSRLEENKNAAVVTFVGKIRVKRTYFFTSLRYLYQYISCLNACLKCISFVSPFLIPLYILTLCLLDAFILLEVDR